MHKTEFDENGLDSDRTRGPVLTFLYNQAGTKRWCEFAGPQVGKTYGHPFIDSSKVPQSPRRAALKDVKRISVRVREGLATD
jgi:hypothetical protein